MSSLYSLETAAPVQTSGPLTGNVLREFRASDTGQGLGHLHAVTVDIVATLFDFIFDDSSVADPIKALVARLQIPVLKVAMLDSSFFSSKAHPARRLLDGISRAAVRCGPRAGHDDPRYARISEVVDRLQNEFKQDTSLFDALSVELDAFLDGQEAAADACAVEAAHQMAPEETVDISPDDANTLGIADSEYVRVSSRRGSVKVKARITEEVPHGLVWMAFHFREGNANWLTNNAGDTTTKTPEYKACAVKIEKIK